MHHRINRTVKNILLKSLRYFPAVALLGPRQCGKTTLAHQIISKLEKPCHYLDLENSIDLRKLEEPVSYLESLGDKLVIIDEVQHRPNLFPEIRGLIDKRRRQGVGYGSFLFLGSASYQLLQQSGESLAGRIAYHELTPFRMLEIPEKDTDVLWSRGGFPDSFLADNSLVSNLWRGNFIDTYLVKDLAYMGKASKVSSMLGLRHLLQMIAHLHGQLLNVEDLAKAHDFSRAQINYYLDLFEQTYLIRRLVPYYANIGKRLVKRSKIYVRDSGILHHLLDIRDFEHLSGHPLRGMSWEGFVIEQIMSLLPNWTPYFYRTSHGAELDLLMQYGSECLAFEVKAASAPTLSKGFYHAIADVKPDQTFVVSRTNETWKTGDDIVHGNIHHVSKYLQDMYP